MTPNVLRWRGHVLTMRWPTSNWWRWSQSSRPSSPGQRSQTILHNKENRRVTPRPAWENRSITQSRSHHLPELHWVQPQHLLHSGGRKQSGENRVIHRNKLPTYLYHVSGLRKEILSEETLQFWVKGRLTVRVTRVVTVAIIVTTIPTQIDQWEGRKVTSQPIRGQKGQSMTRITKTKSNLGNCCVKDLLLLAMWSRNSIRWLQGATIQRLWEESGARTRGCHLIPCLRERQLEWHTECHPRYPQVLGRWSLRSRLMRQLMAHHQRQRNQPLLLAQVITMKIEVTQSLKSKRISLGQF